MQFHSLTVNSLNQNINNYLCKGSFLMISKRPFFIQLIKQIIKLKDLIKKMIILRKLSRIDERLLYDHIFTYLDFFFHRPVHFSKEIQCSKLSFSFNYIKWKKLVIKIKYVLLFWCIKSFWLSKTCSPSW